MKHMLSVLLIVGSAAAMAQVAVDVRDPWVRATVAQQKATGAFMQLTAKSDSKLVEARSPVAGVVEIHEMSMDKDVMKMRQIPGLILPAGKTVELKPGGYHVMLMDLKGQVKEGDAVPLTLVFEGKDGKRESVEVKATVRPLANMPGMSQAPAHGAHKH